MSLTVLLFGWPHAHAQTKGASLPAAHTVGIIPYYSPEKIWKAFSPFVEYLNRATNVKWELKLYTDHDTLIGDLCAGRLSLAFVGPVPMGRLSARCGAVPLVQSLGPDGKPFYHAVIVTTHPEIRSLADVKGRRVGFFKGSTAAHVVPALMLRSAGIGAKDVQSRFYASQNDIVMALLRNEIDAAGVKDALAAKYRETGLRTIERSEPLPHFVFSALPTLDPSVQAQFREALLRLQPRSSAADRALTAPWDDEIRNGFILPPPALMRDAARLASLHDEIMHEYR